MSHTPYMPKTWSDQMEFAPADANHIEQGIRLVTDAVAEIENDVLPPINETLSMLNTAFVAIDDKVRNLRTRVDKAEGNADLLLKVFLEGQTDGALPPYLVYDPALNKLYYEDGN